MGTPISRPVLALLILASFFGCVLQQTHQNATTSLPMDNFSASDINQKIGESYDHRIVPPINETTPPTENQAINLTGNGTANETPLIGNQTGKSICGDGVISADEQCDHGNYTTDKCPQGYYCSRCQCKKLETAVICGDGKISSPDEECDGGNVDYSICPIGYSCQLCKCVPVQARCGDGKITPPEECDPASTSTYRCPSGKVCSSCRCVVSGQPKAAVCGNNVREGNETCDGTDAAACNPEQYCQDCRCVIRVPVCGDGKIEGTEQCENDSGCPSNFLCSGCRCVPDIAHCGDGILQSSEQCEQGIPCDEGYHCSGCRCIVDPPLCGDGKINGNEQCDPNASPTGCRDGVCSLTCQCVSQPTLDCGRICESTPRAQSIGGNFTTQAECTAAAVNYFMTKTCSLTCSYAHLYQAANIAGSCCCGIGTDYPCTSCPCEGVGCDKGCPSEQTCQQNAPSWYQP